MSVYVRERVRQCSAFLQWLLLFPTWHFSVFKWSFSWWAVRAPGSPLCPAASVPTSSNLRWMVPHTLMLSIPCSFVTVQNYLEMLTRLWLVSHHPLVELSCLSHLSHGENNPPSQPSLWGHLLCCQPLRLILAISVPGFVVASMGMFTKRASSLLLPVMAVNHSSAFSLYLPLPGREGAAAMKVSSGSSHLQ